MGVLNEKLKFGYSNVLAMKKSHKYFYKYCFTSKMWVVFLLISLFLYIYCFHDKKSPPIKIIFLKFSFIIILISQYPRH